MTVMIKTMEDFGCAVILNHTEDGTPWVEVAALNADGSIDGESWSELVELQSQEFLVALNKELGTDFQMADFNHPRMKRRSGAAKAKKRLALKRAIKRLKPSLADEIRHLDYESLKRILLRLRSVSLEIAELRAGSDKKNEKV